VDDPNMLAHCYNPEGVNRDTEWSEPLGIDSTVVSNWWLHPIPREQVVDAALRSGRRDTLREDVRVEILDNVHNREKLVRKCRGT
jgi:hypothetical protein